MDVPTQEQICYWLRLFLEPGQVTELRALNVEGKTHSGYFDYEHCLEMAEAALRLSGRASGVYFVPNPIDPVLFKNRPCRVGPAFQLTKDANIVRRKWMLVDFDPVRATKVSSTDTEKELARIAMEECLELGQKLGWKRPIVGDSGNGYHLCYPMDLPNNKQSQQHIRTCLLGIQKRFESPQVQVDISVHNASRIWKLYGTLARKGLSSPSRPHRYSRILENCHGNNESLRTGTHPQTQPAG